MEATRTQRFADEIDRTEHLHFVGRGQEIRFFLQWLTDQGLEGRILNISGTGGIGKSYLLNEFRRFLGQNDILFLFLDCQSVAQTPDEFCRALLHLLHVPSPKTRKKQTDIGLLTDYCAEEIRRVADQGQLILALDTFEQFGEMEKWFRDDFLVRLSPNILTIISGRLPLQGEWLSSPAWRKLIYRMPLNNLEYQAVEQYLKRVGIEQEEIIQQVWTLTKGHPLTLSLSVSTTLARTPSQSFLPDLQDIFPYVVSVWLKEVPDPCERKLVEAAAIAWQFNQELLSFILETDVTSEHFQKLVGHSFIRRADRGWMIHDMLRDAIGYELRLRAPEYYHKLWKRCILYHYFQIKQALHNQSVPMESTNWVYFMGHRLIRSLFYQQSVTYSLEPLHHSNWDEARQYIENRHQQARNVIIRDTDPETKRSYEYVFKARESLYGLKHIRLGDRYDLDPGSIKLIRDTKGNLFGLTEIIPIHEQTLDYLISNPPYAAYFSSLSETRLNELRTPKESIAGYFISLIDVLDYSDLFMRQAAGLIFISHMLTAGLLITTAPAIPFFNAIFQSLGLQKVKDVFHFDYDSQIPTPYYIMDTRGDKLLEYLNAMLVQLGISQDKKDSNEHILLLSKREREIAGLLIRGCSNAEIAGKLYLSEATVKKHVSNIFKKLDVKNRGQLMNKYSEIVAE